MTVYTYFKQNTTLVLILDWVSRGVLVVLYIVIKKIQNFILNLGAP